MKGWISVHRKLIDNPIWSDPNLLKLWMYCLFKASHKQHEQLVGNQLIKLERGQFITGRKALAEDMNKGVKPLQQLSEKSWERALKNFEKWEMLTIKVTNKFSVVTIDKYEDYQIPISEVDQVIDQQLTNSCPTDDQQLTTNNNVNKGNNENNDKKDIKKEYAETVFLKEEEYKKLVEDFGEQLVKDTIERLDEWQTNNPKKKKKDHNKTIRVWLKDKKPTRSGKGVTSGKNKDADEYGLNF